MRIVQPALSASFVLAAMLSPIQSRQDVLLPPTGQISGLVTSDKAGTIPVRRASVTIRGERTGEVVVVSGADGRFTADRLSADRYTIFASRPAYLVGNFGASRPGGAGIPLMLADGERRSLTLWMARGAVISGRVIAPDGLPAAGVMVSALAATVVDGQRVLLASATAPAAVVDDEGRFRIYGLRPAAYVVTVRPGAGVARGLEVGGPAGGRARIVNYSQVYFPGTTDLADARRIEVAAGEEAAGIDIPLQLDPAAPVTGVIRIDGESTLPPGTRLQLTRVVRGLAPYDAGESVTVDASGRFRIAPLGPGRYALNLVNLTLTPPTAQAGEKPRMYWGRAEFEVSGEPVDDVVVQLKRGLDLLGEVSGEAGPEAPPFNATGISVSLQGIVVDGIRPANPAAVRPDATGKFTLSGVGPGRYRVSASLPPMSGRTPGWFLRTIAFDGTVLPGDVLEVSDRAPASTLAITFTTRPTRLDGRLILENSLPATGYAVVAFPVQELAWTMQSRYIQHARPSTDGSFSITNLPVGQYYVCALTELAPSDLADPDFLKALIPAAIRVTVKNGETPAVTLKIAR